MGKKKRCALCGGGVSYALHDGALGEAKVRLCAKCLTMLRTHPEERALLALVHFGHPRAIASPRRRAGE